MVCSLGDSAHLSRSKDFKTDTITEKTLVTQCFNFQDTLEAVKENIQQYTKKVRIMILCERRTATYLIVSPLTQFDPRGSLHSPHSPQDGPGTILLCYSCLLSRTPALVTSDMDSNFGVAPKMIGNHGYANQEFVNLFLTGAATSNLFDGEKVRLGTQASSHSSKR